MGRPWWHDDYWEKRGRRVSRPKDEFVEHFERQRKSGGGSSFWIIIVSLIFIAVVFIILAYIFLIGVGT